MIDKTKAAVDGFLNFMQLPDGTPLVPVDMIEWLISNGFFVAPASIKYHGNHEGGLFKHSYMAAKALVGMSEREGLWWSNPRSPWVVGMFHDLCKIDQYRHPIVGESLNGVQIPDEYRWEYNPDTLLKGHGDKSVMLLSQFYTLTEEEILCIRYHMGAFVEKEEWNLYTGAINLYPNVLWTHQADMLASHVAGV